MIDTDGDAIALTTTINTGFGNKFVGGRTGVLLNNEMDDFIVKLASTRTVLSGAPRAAVEVARGRSRV